MMLVTHLRSQIVTALVLALTTSAAQAAWHFTDVTAAAGLSYQHGYTTGPGFREPSENAGGVAAGDYDGDGRVDLYVVRGDIGPNLLFRNRGDGTFEEVGAAAGVALSGVRSSGPLFADLDGDGRLDLVVGGVEGTPVSVFRNAGNGTFTDVTATSGIVLPAGPPTRDTFGLTAGDYDRDGDLDLFLTHWLSAFFNFPDTSSFHLWRNDGTGAFTDVTLAAGITPLGPGDNFNSFTANFADIDGDRWPDLLVTGDFRTSRIYRNNRNGTFTLANDFTVITDGNGMGGAIGDYDGDGDLDWFVSSIWDPNGVAEGNWDTSGNRLYRNRGNGTFEDATDAAGVRVGYWGWASTFQDFDNDGDLDLFHVNGFGRAEIPQTAEFVADPSVLLVGNGDGTFTERGAELGVADTDEGRGVVAFDYDGDGDLDLFVHNSEGPGRLYRNEEGNAGRWLDVALRGRTPNTEGIGARIRMTANGKTQVREVRAGSNYVSQDPAVAHFGLGAARVATVEVVWLDGTRSVREKVAADQHLVIDQPPPGVDEQTKQQQECIIALNTTGAKLAATVGKRLVGCVQDATRGALPPGMSGQACLSADPQGRIAKAAAKTTDAAAKKCPLVPTFGPATAAAVNAAMADVLRPQDVFGPDLDAALIDARVDPAGARCQTTVAKTVAKIAAAKLKAFNACKTSGLKRGTIKGQADLASCHAAMTKAVAKGQKAAAKGCADADLAAALPGRCGGRPLAELATCLEEQSACSACMALDGADRLATPCHRFQDGVAVLYCGDRPITDQSIARQWNEQLLAAIRRDTPRTTVHARNLQHLSGLMWDVWRAYGGGGSAWRSDESHVSAAPNRDRSIAISFAAYRLLAHRFKAGPGAAITEAALAAKLYALGYDVGYTTTEGDTPAAVGNRMAATIAFGLTDGSNEARNYADPTYTPINPPLVVKQPGTSVADPNFWQPLALDQIITQNGIPVPDKVQIAIGARWNQVTPFALTRSDPNDVYIDPGPPPQLGGVDDAGYKEGARRVIELESFLTPDDGVIDISPSALGNNPLGSNAGSGHPLNPFTGQPYAPNVVPRGDFGRVLAEFWADGPNSETPPGHWNVFANEVSDHPLTTHRIGGTGPVLDRLEWDVKLYFALNGAVHDAAITAWGLKRKYDSARPITMIRDCGALGQSSDPGGPSYHPQGLPLQPGVIEVITAATTAPGERHAHLAGHESEIAVRAWAGEPAAPATQIGGIGVLPLQPTGRTGARVVPGWQAARRCTAPPRSLAKLQDRERWLGVPQARRPFFLDMPPARHGTRPVDPRSPRLEPSARVAKGGYQMRHHRITNRALPRAVGRLALATALSLTAVTASAQTLSAPSLSNASSANEATASTANPSYQRFSSTSTLSSGASSFQTRYFGNASADCGPACSSRTETLASNYTVSWTATAPNIYSLQIDTRRTAGLTIGDDGSNGAQATMGALSCSPSGGTVTSGGCTLADPADNTSGSTSDVNVNQTNQVLVCGQSLGSPIAHSVNFTWSQTAFTPSTGFIQINMDEAAVRVGANNLDASNTAANYPGTGSRTQSNDGHFVTVAITNLCGNGVIDTCGVASEQCDQGGLNGTAGSCCTTSCTFKTVGTTCRAAAGVCDAVETCTGASANCPADGFLSSSTPCRPSAGVCDVAENCTGSGPTCPADAFQSSSTVCRPSAGVCDVAENCTGSGAACPADAFESSSTLCRPSAGICDVAENCTGSGAACPADAFESSSTLCRASAGVCDVAENCTGSGAACPGDGFQPNTVVCRPGSGDSCDPDENCTGSGAACPGDVVSPNGTVCNPGSGDLCDPDELCSGNPGDPCPADSVSGAFVVCRPAAGDCDAAENCPGVANQPCPADGFLPSSTVCRASADVCDVAENCTGSGPTCPADAFESPSTVCRASAGVCDVAENCTGSGAACPADAFEPGTTVCRPGSGDLCDPDENCTGSGAACPADVVSSSSTVCNPGSGDLCDPDETCTGNPGDPCPADTVAPNTTVCRPAAGGCDVPDNCTGTADQPCPADSVSGAFVTCRPAAGVCDVAENCDGSNAACPADGKSTALCRGPAGVCDLAENCDGVNNGCPPDAKSTAVCRAAAGVCDVAESCNGLTDNCPADAFASSSTVCRPSAGVCDVAESCTGSSASCPADTGLPDSDSDTVCDAVDNCDTIANPSQSNGDADALGDACDPCTNSVPTVQSKVKLTLTKILAPAGDDKLSFKGFFSSVPASPTIDPVTNGMRFLITESTGATPVDITIPGGAYNAANKVGWKVNGSGTSWTYKNAGNPVPLVNGITKMQLKKLSSPPGKYKVGVKGKNGTYPVNAVNLPLVGTIVIDVPYATTGQCGEATFPAVPPAKPSCVAASGGKTVKCK